MSHAREEAPLCDDIAPRRPAERTLPALLERQAAALGDRPFLTVGETRRSFAEMRDAVAGLAACVRRRRRRSRAIGSRSWPRTASRCSTRGSPARGSAPSSCRSTPPPAGRSCSTSSRTPSPRVLALEPEFLGHLDVLDEVPGGARAHLVARRRVDDRRLASGCRSSRFPSRVRAGGRAPGRPWRHGRDPLHVRHDRPVEGRDVPAGAVLLVGALDRARCSTGSSADDVLYTCLPLFHTNALNACMQALVHGAQFVVGPRFSASRFWDRVAEADATVTYLLGAMVSILAKTPESPAEQQHRRARGAGAGHARPTCTSSSATRFRRGAARRLRDDRDERRDRRARRPPAGRGRWAT